MRGGQTFFDLFNLIDATTEPEVNPPKEVWLGARIVAATEDNETDDAMLHDDFFDARRDYDKHTRKREAEAKKKAAKKSGRK